MGLYRARDLLLAPNLLSLLRVPLAAAFPWSAGQPASALAVLFAAGLTDVLDGWIARTRKQVTAIGAVVDPITDKLFVLTVMITLITSGALPVWGAVLLSVREVGEAPLVLWWAVSRKKRRARTDAPRANVPGKIATTLQFAAVALALVDSPWLPHALFVAAVAGALAALAYWMRELAPVPQDTCTTGQAPELPLHTPRERADSSR
ncbi:CDP-alcohol phosphatidyltransferase family protein [Myxococcota bacterium]|nr:CDP-alcohol phosphatidyltransferase family protein [Myxococcota bacterium]